MTTARLVALGAGVAALVVATVAGLALSGATVTGRTSQERIASICRLADERPRGAADAIAAAAGESDPAVRQAAMLALGRFLGPKHRPVVEAGTRDASGAVRASAAATLGLYDDDAAAARLGELLTGDPEEQVRMEAATGLGRLRGQRGLALLAQAVESNDNPGVRVRALHVLGEKFGARFSNPPDPGDAAAWAEVVRTARRLAAIGQGPGQPPPGGAKRE